MWQLTHTSNGGSRRCLVVAKVAAPGANDESATKRRRFSVGDSPGQRLGVSATPVGLSQRDLQLHAALRRKGAPGPEDMAAARRLRMRDSVAFQASSVAIMESLVSPAASIASMEPSGGGSGSDSSDMEDVLNEATQMAWALSDSSKVAESTTAENPRNSRSVDAGNQGSSASIPDEDVQMEWALAESVKLATKGYDAALTIEINNFKWTLEYKCSTEGALLSAIAELEKRGPFSVDVLKATMIGKTLNQLARSSSSDSVKQEASRLVRSWRSSYGCQT